MTTAKEIKEMLREAETTGRNLYYDSLDHDRQRVIRVKQVAGVARILLMNGLWLQIIDDVKHRFSIL